ncbi:HelD family protein [Corynebacterium uterequi]|uniref:DNA/RNA helicase, superfamily I n=1 Tax=Corynebacterium uterequi TaxID=1072256 RepID=A0A0G3HCG5_9CORY|nr:AAA family ATPase [Corynebacterium uterequi]AKK10999.1 DNA/RNA helicase, superfamily I [Corynebacterium uterequi]
MTRKDDESAIAAEQAYVDGLFARLDEEVARANERLRQVQLEVDEPGNPDNVEALIRRETEYHGLNTKLDRLAVAQLGLVFGRIDVASHIVENPVPGQPGVDRRYIGRMGLDDRADNYRSLLIDWRAPMARPFYLATTAQPEGVRLRRHIRTSGRTVTRIDDEALSADVDASERAGVGSESALHHALSQPRTGRMQSIVETIQREQDEIIRDPHRGVMVVQGGPGTGKTAVALHRVAYLLYTYRDQLAKTGVLIVGPNSTFLDYISRVLPELGETGVVLSTVGELYPGVRPSRDESLLAREVKGSAEMVTILREAVRRYQRVPENSMRVRSGSIELDATPDMIKAARTRARRSRKAHNDARGLFAEHLTEALARELGERIGADPLGGRNLLSDADIDQLHDDLAEEPSVEALIDALWPFLTPAQVLEELLSSAEFIDDVAADYDDATRHALYREPGLGWAASDAALLDELFVLIGASPAELHEDEASPEDDSWSQELADAENAIDILSSSDSTDNDDDQFEAEILSAADVIDAQHLAQRQEVRDHRSTAERAAADHEWAYGHVIVDEAQELTPMEWRMIFRRCPGRWMTVVGDTAQTGAPAGTDSWEVALEPFVGGRFRRHELTVNYRTPAEIMEVANELLTIIDPSATPALAIRSTGEDVTWLPTGSPVPTDLGAGSCRVIDAATVGDIKGLEFDHVIVEEPADIVEASPQGWQDLYVAVTRATRTLTVIGDWPQP